MVFAGQRERWAILSTGNSNYQWHVSSLPVSPPQSGCRPPKKICRSGPAVIMEPAVVSRSDIYCCWCRIQWWKVYICGI